MKDIFDKIDQQAKTWKYRKSAELTAKMIRYNNRHSDKVINADNIAELTGLSENVVKQILAGIWKSNHDYEVVEGKLDQLLKKG